MFCFLNKLARSFQFFYFHLFIETLKFENTEQYKTWLQKHIFYHSKLTALIDFYVYCESPWPCPSPIPSSLPLSPWSGGRRPSADVSVEGQKLRPISCNTSDFCWSSQSRGFRGERPVRAENLTPSNNGEGQSDKGTPCISNSYLAP